MVITAPDLELDIGIRTCLDRITAAWDAGDARAYAAQFTPDASYVIYVGDASLGRDAIERAHARLFATWLKGTRMDMRIIQARHIAPGTAVVLTEGGIGKGRTIRRDKLQTFTLVEEEDGAGDPLWRCAAFQNTRRNRLLLRVQRLFDRNRGA